MEGGPIGEVSYKELRSGEIEVMGKKVKTSGLSSYHMAREIANILKEWIREGRFFLSQAVEGLPGPHTGYRFKPLHERGIE
jgi:uncharacterized protein (DUF39 family)